MLVRFSKAAVNAPADTLTCERPDGTLTHGAMPKQAILPRHAFHFVVETTLGWRTAFFGQIANGTSLDDLTANAHEPKSHRVKNPVALQSAGLVECLQAEQWAGASDPATFAAALAAACRRHRVVPPALTPGDLARLRTALRDFGAAWRPLAPGQSLERTF